MDRVFPSWAVDSFAHTVARLCYFMSEPRAAALRESVMRGWDQAHADMFQRGYSLVNRHMLCNSVQIGTKSASFLSVLQ